MSFFKITTPVSADDVARLKIGDEVHISGTIYTLRDAAHARLYDLIKRNEDIPVDLKDQLIYYAGPTPARPGKAVGSAGPTTSCRMDKYTPLLLEKGMRGAIGKGKRSEFIKNLFNEFKAVYFVAVGGAGALLSAHIMRSRVVAYPELGPEAIYEFEVKDFPVIVAYDCHGRDIFEEGKKIYRRDDTI